MELYGEDAFSRIDRTLDRIDAHVEAHRQEFELAKEVMAHLLRQSRENHAEVMARLQDLGVYMREQTQALMRINERLGSGDEPA